jgi:NAD(P)-dependent dehydrogenase (short-subunit alcohol dehydrogenase family)
LGSELPEDKVQKAREQIVTSSSGQNGRVEEAAWSIYQFAVPEAAWTTGAVLTVDRINLT